MTQKLRIILILVASIALARCGNPEQSKAVESNTPNFKAEAKKLNAVLAKYEEPSQAFTIPSNKPAKVKGKQGTIISVNPDDLITESGEPLGATIEVELKELGNQNQLLKANAQTLSNGELLVSGGAYYINITSGSKQLKLKEGKGLDVEFPKLSDNEMSLFYGSRDSLGAINWKPANETFKSKQSQPAAQKPESVTKSKKTNLSEMDELLAFLGDTSKTNLLTKEEKEKIDRGNKLYQKVYASMKISEFGWINCDRFLNVQNKTDLMVNFNPADSIRVANLYLVFKDINSVMQTYYFNYKDKAVNEAFKNIPVGYKVRLVAYSIKEEKVFSYASDLTVKEKQTMTLALKETSDEELKKLLNN